MDSNILHWWQKDCPFFQTFTTNAKSWLHVLVICIRKLWLTTNLWVFYTATMGCMRVNWFKTVAPSLVLMMKVSLFKIINFILIKPNFLLNPDNWYALFKLTLTKALRFVWSLQVLKIFFFIENDLFSTHRQYWPFLFILWTTQAQPSHIKQINERNVSIYCMGWHRFHRVAKALDL